MGLSFTIAAGLSQRSHSRTRVPRDPWSYFTVSDSRLLQPGGPDPRIYIPQERDGPLTSPGIGFTLRRLLWLAWLRWTYSNPLRNRLHYCVFALFRGNNVPTELFPSSGCLHNCYLAVDLHVTICSKVCLYWRYVGIAKPRWVLLATGFSPQRNRTDPVVALVVSCGWQRGVVGGLSYGFSLLHRNSNGDPFLFLTHHLYMR
jgi:hypothetical protein